MNELVKHIESINAKMQKDGWNCKLSTDLAHWNEQGIFTPEQFDINELANRAYDLHKTVYGFRPHFGHLKDMGKEGLLTKIQSLTDEYVRQREEVAQVRIARKLAKRKAWIKKQEDRQLAALIFGKNRA